MKKGTMALLMACLLVAGIVFQPFAAAAEDGLQQQEDRVLSQDLVPQAQRAVHNDVIDSITAVLSDGSGPVGTVSWDQRFRLDAAFTLPDDRVRAGDTTVIALPDELAFYYTTGFPIADASGNIVANGVIDGPAKTLTLTYTDYPETHSNVTGDFHFYVRIDHSVVTTEQDVELVFGVGSSEVRGGTIHSGPPPPPSPATMLAKASWQSSGDNPRLFNHTIKVNREGVKIDNAVLTDVKGQSGDAYNQGSLRIRKGTWAVQGSGWSLENRVDVTGQYPVEWDPSGLSFKIRFGDIAEDEGFAVTYTTEAQYDPVVGEVFRNDSTLTGTAIETQTSGGTVVYYQAGGSAEGYTYSIRVMKEDAGTGDALAGATFDVIRVATGAVVGTATTDAAGMAEFTGLLRDAYLLEEVEAPLGYVPLAAPISVPADAFGDDKVALVPVENRLETTSFPVAKVWIGPEGGGVTVRLLADGSDAGQALALSAEGGWTGRFADLPKRDPADGHEIAYTVVEDPVDGYAAEVSGDAERGFTVTNSPVSSEDPTPPTPPTPPVPTVPPAPAAPPAPVAPPPAPAATSPTPSVAKAPKTGESLDPVPLAALAVSALAVLAFALRRGRRGGRE